MVGYENELKYAIVSNFEILISSATENMVNPKAKARYRF